MSIGSPHAGVPLIVLCAKSCGQRQAFGLVCDEHCALPAGHAAPCLCRWCLTGRFAQRKLREQADGRRHAQTIEHLVFAGDEQRAEKRRTQPRDRWGRRGKETRRQ